MDAKAKSPLAMGVDISVEIKQPQSTYMGPGLPIPEGCARPSLVEITPPCSRSGSYSLWVFEVDTRPFSELGDAIGSNVGLRVRWNEVQLLIC